MDVRFATSISVSTVHSFLKYIFPQPLQGLFNQQDSIIRDVFPLKCCTCPIVFRLLLLPNHYAMEEIFSGFIGSELLFYSTVIAIIPVNINFSLWPKLLHQTFEKINHLNKTDSFWCRSHYLITI